MKDDNTVCMRYAYPEIRSSPVMQERPETNHRDRHRRSRGRWNDDGNEDDKSYLGWVKSYHCTPSPDVSFTFVLPHCSSQKNRIYCPLSVPVGVVLTANLLPDGSLVYRLPTVPNISVWCLGASMLTHKRSGAYDGWLKECQPDARNIDRNSAKQGKLLSKQASLQRPNYEFGGPQSNAVIQTGSTSHKNGIT